MAALVKALAEDASVPVMLHLDHGPSLELAYACLRAGFSSVMFDGAGRELAEVVRLGRTLTEVAHAQGAAVEVAAESFSGAGALTEPDAALALRDGSGADMVAVAVGSEHGRVSSLDIARLEALAHLLRSPLVLHGGSGIPAQDLAAARALGVVKVNVGSALYRALRGTWEGGATLPNHRAVYAAARAALYRVARDKLQLMQPKSSLPFDTPPP